MEKRGPKRRDIDYHEVKLLASIFCSEEEIAERLGFAYSGFRKRRERDKELVAALKRGRSDAVRSLRAHQLQAAKKGNATMLVWLGKQYLKQIDKPQPEGEDSLIDFVFGPKREDQTESERRRAEQNLEAALSALRSRGHDIFRMPSPEKCKEWAERLNRRRGFDVDELLVKQDASEQSNGAE